MSVIREVFRLDTLVMHECTDGYYLYDKVAGINISMGAKAERDAFIAGILHYQKYHTKLSQEYKELCNKVDSVLSILIVEED